jgi:hypothetical protein
MTKTLAGPPANDTEAGEEMRTSRGRLRLHWVGHAMNMLSARRIQELSTDPARCTRPFRMSPIDLSRPFIHEDFTPLYHTPRTGIR